jgi:hypothetical protein
MRNFLRLAFAALFVLLAACGGSPGSVSGTVHGAAVPVTDAISAAVSINTTAGTVHEAVIVLANHAQLCSDAMTNTAHPNEKGVIIGLSDVNGATATAPTAPGMYAIYQGTGVPPPKVSSLAVSVSDATCTTIMASGAKASTGSINLTAVSGNKFSGTFDVALDSGDHITGSFDPEECPALQTLLNQTTMSSCV